MTNFYTTKLTDKEICKINKYIKTKITVGNCHIWNGQQLKGYGIFETSSFHNAFLYDPTQKIYSHISHYSQQPTLSCKYCSFQNPHQLFSSFQICYY
jgi:hypothetical protein